MSIQRWSKSTALALGAIFILALFGVFAATQLSAHGGNSDQIHACVNAKSGEIKIVAAGQSCKKNETSLDWNAQRSAVKNIDGVISTYFVSTGRYHVESTKANEGDSLPLDMDIVKELCQDEDGCSVTIGMRDWADSQPGNVASRGPTKLFMSETAGSNWWRSNPSAGSGGNFDRAGNDGDGVFTGHVARAWACLMTELEYTDFVWVDEEVGFSLLNWTAGFGGTFTDPDMVCVLDIDD
jgi:hypothetical protein